jgi:serine/threonine protein kinase
MDLGAFTLNDYIKYLHHNCPSSFDIETKVMKNGVCIRQDCSDPQRAHNLWVIGCHIAGGLQFLHQRQHVHRDLKPNNGSSGLDA